ncbi:hypothetical protein PMI16_01554 [Herbaspirillum sp. CF444]|uniref:cytochrome oxidase putative small subunit CydP n=1 Tax=Herbaspirillum sp. CF444 TaxID=1144319 RepID=UPI00027268B0|nr:cytochrome oxidase putative small subunit CydP [Herbaspirillum sp. CF444]EJL91597.1 hypothetical protein PMI16_01554 [Herbaspirillum sp. CF444]
MPRPSWLFRIHRLSRLPRLTQLPLGAEIALILLVKIAILTVLAKTFFSEPQAKKMRMPTEQVELHLLAPATAATSATAATITTGAVTTFTSTLEVTHASH